MAKRKTRKQKILADSRHIQYTLETTTAQEILPTEKKTKYELPEFTSPITKKIPALTLNHVSADIRKTSIVTASIVAAQLILFIVLRI